MRKMVNQLGTTADSESFKTELSVIRAWFFFSLNLIIFKSFCDFFLLHFQAQLAALHQNSVHRHQGQTQGDEGASGRSFSFGTSEGALQFPEQTFDFRRQFTVKKLDFSFISELFLFREGRKRRSCSSSGWRATSRRPWTSSRTFSGLRPRGRRSRWRRLTVGPSLCSLRPVVVSFPFHSSSFFFFRGTCEKI